jgi:hypothetical protein
MMCGLHLAGTLSAIFLAATGPQPKVITLPDWTPPADVQRIAFSMEPGGLVSVWGRGQEVPRVYFDELLPALFDRTLMLDKLSPADARLEWIFTGDRGGVTIVVDGSHVELFQRYYDSVGYAEQKGRSHLRNPEWSAPAATVTYQGNLRTISVTMDHKLSVSVALNGRPVIQQVCPIDVSRHQLRLTGKHAASRGSLLLPAAQECQVRVDSAERHQTMLGFGGIATPMAYASLSEEGKHRWWELVCQYNLLVQREYPNGARLHAEMDNWDRLSDAAPHYYGDNFPNSEISDFHYLKILRRLGGKVWFEFWILPPWVKSDPQRYAEAMVRYCRTSQERAGAPPDVVGIQNEMPQTAEMWGKMTLALRRELDRAGFRAVKIHMSDAGGLCDSEMLGGLQRARAFAASPEVWSTIDYAATHMYDYQGRFGDPDRFDARLTQWKQLTAGHPFLSTELCVNSPAYQWPSYRLALSMGQLYHKNLVLCDAAGICYCWTLLNVVQPSYGWTRTLFVPDTAHGSVPAASSHQLRVFGAYSRRIREGMVRVDAKSSSADLLAACFAGHGGEATAVLANRGMRPARVRLTWPGVRFTEVERVDPYCENVVARVSQSAGNASELLVQPGAIITLSSVELGRLPAQAFEPKSADGK